MQTNLRDEEPGLYEIVHPLIIHWKLLFGGILAGMLIAAAISFRMPKQYETGILLNIGMGADKLLEDPGSVTRIINSDSFQQTAAAKVGLELSPKQLRKMIEAETDTIRLSPWVFVTVLADSPQRAVGLANAVGEGIVARHTKFFNEKLEGYAEYKAELERNLKMFSAEADSLKSNLNTFKIRGQEDSSTVILLETKLGEKQTQMLVLKRELRDINSWISKVHSRNTALAGPPVLPKKPSKPNIKLNVAIAGVGSLFLMVSLILLMEQYRKGSLRF